ncbi:hypothetical protein K1W54_04920 [Micromonospora sp. CPCC 205371]|nr:hypothetical protein [Micromonospora sp. CPCC 205371]
MCDRETVQRGPVHEVAERQYSDPIPDDLLPLIEQAGLIVHDHDDHVTAYRNDRMVGCVWGPAVEGEWFGHREGSNPVRLPDRIAALRFMVGADAEAVAE